MDSASKVPVIAVLGLRVAYGIGLVAVPTRLVRRWLGSIDASTSVALRGLGAREVLLHSLALGSALRGGPVRPFLAASIAGDLTDIAATATARRGLPRGSTSGTLAVAGASAAISAGVAAHADR